MNYKIISSTGINLVLIRLPTRDTSVQVAKKIGSNSYRINSNVVLEL